VRVWDIHPGYLNRQSLLGEHREIHAIWSILSNNKKGYSQHPETRRWRGRLWALGRRHDQVAAEMGLRSYRHLSPLPAAPDGTNWPDSFVNSPGEQFRILASKYLEREAGRIPLPSSPQELWAQHKYSVLARDPGLYRRIGSSVARLPPGTGLEELSLELVAQLRTNPSSGGVRNAVEHLWGHVSKWADAGERVLAAERLQESPASLMREISRLAFEHQVTYVLRSTALSDFDADGC
jgi:hypothetical protein